jgi:hypothetical protein
VLHRKEECCREAQAPLWRTCRACGVILAADRDVYRLLPETEELSHAKIQRFNGVVQVLVSKSNVDSVFKPIAVVFLNVYETNGCKNAELTSDFADWPANDAM